MKRNLDIDATKGLGIILMILGHSIILTDNWGNYFFKVIFSFHMPLFFIFSGYFYNPNRITDILKKGLNKLLLPYVLSSVIALLILLPISMEGFIRCLYGFIIGTIGNHDSLINWWPIQAGPVWFLMALFWCRLAYRIVEYVPTIAAKKRTLEISIILSILFIVIGKNYVNIPLCFGAGMTGLVFYAVGHRIKEYGIENITFWFSIFVVWLGAMVYANLNMAQYIYRIMPLSILGGIAGSLIAYRFVSLQCPCLKKILGGIGQKSLVILCCHAIAFQIKDHLPLQMVDISKPLYNDLAYLLLTLMFTTIVICWQIRKSFVK